MHGATIKIKAYLSHLLGHSRDISIDSEMLLDNLRSISSSAVGNN